MLFLLRFLIFELLFLEKPQYYKPACNFTSITGISSVRPLLELVSEGSSPSHKSLCRVISQSVGAGLFSQGTVTVSGAWHAGTYSLNSSICINGATKPRARELQLPESSAPLGSTVCAGGCESRKDVCALVPRLQ